MQKTFYDVFEKIELPAHLSDLAEEIVIEKLVAIPENKKLKVHLQSKRLIDRKDIHALEYEIHKQIFRGTSSLRVEICETFALSEYYTAESVYQAYRESILEDMMEIGKLDYHIIASADVSFENGNKVIFTIQDTVVSRDRQAQLVKELNDIFNRRCGIDACIEIAFKEPEFNKYKEEDAYKINMMVKSISDRINKKGNTDAGAEFLEYTDDKNAKNASEPAANKDKDIKKGNAKKEKEEVKHKSLKRCDIPDVIFGKDVENEAISICDIQEGIGDVTIRGKIIELDGHELRSGKYVISFAVTDFTDTIVAKIFCWPEQKEEIEPSLKKGIFVKLQGIAKYDDFAHEVTITSILGIRLIQDFTTPRKDNAFKKRVELHCHTKMSDSDGVSYAKDLINRAISWGMSSIAITDHGVVQAFPEAFHTVEKNDSFKVLYGVEGYLVDDLDETVSNEKGQSIECPYVVFSLTTTGLSPLKEQIIEIGAVKLINNEIKESYHSYVNPKRPIPFQIERVTGIKDEMVAKAPYIEGALSEFFAFAKDSVLVSHNATTERAFLQAKAEEIGISYDFTCVDSMSVARAILTERAKHDLKSIAKEYGITFENESSVTERVNLIAEAFRRFIFHLQKQQIATLAALNDMTASSIEAIRKLPSYHVIILAKNEMGRRALYKLVSESHVNYYYRRPRIPKSLLASLRENLIIGSACEAGELFRALLEERTDEQLANIVQFYDYLEIQPIGNNRFMIRDEKYPHIRTDEDLIAYNRKIVELGEIYNKPVCATCDVHFMDPEDEIYRRIIMAGKGFQDADEQAPLFLRTTEEMLAEFEYLGSKKAEEVVITNTNMIADLCERVSPIHPDKCPPVIENSDETLTNICYNKAHEIYGENLPEIVEARLQRELNSIITNGFAVMYIIAQKLVWKSNEDGYLVGSRGSVGSSFVATMAGITEVNPLVPHYYCSECHYSEFESEDTKPFAGKAGCDMPDKNCPNCGALLKKDGFDIPFETFLGFKGDKEPDIDLNFSGEYQSKAHKYTEVIFGAGQTYRAGTIGTLAEKTAFGYVKKYFEERGVVKRESEINRIVQGCVDVRRTTGQHPGGIIVLPIGYDINQFTPIQRPANDMTTDIITTHFDYHSIDHNLLKLDILGHDDPTMIRMLQDLTGIDPLTIPLDDKDVMSLFQNTHALGIEPNDIMGCKLGSLGIPEFGTDFAMQMLLDTKPQRFSDLVRISGLSHGTDVWLGNAQTLIEEGKATISTAICTRDDIMTYLIGMGVEASLSFTIMESVRKGKGLKAEWEQAMRDHNVPEWYIWSCKKIKYMFPKAHAAAYVMMAWRIAYCKVNYPLAYYSAYFSIRATAFSYEIMCQGEEHLVRIYEEYKSREDKLSNKEIDAMKDMRIVQEMYARGFEFEPLDIFRANARTFQIIDGKIMPSLISVDGVAEKAAEGIVEAVKDGPFLSQDNFRERTKCTKTVTETLARLGLLGDLPESNQISLFDFV